MYLFREPFYYAQKKPRAARHSIYCDIQASRVGLTLTTYQATVESGGTSVDASKDSLSLTTYAATISAATEVTAAKDTKTLATYQASIDLGTATNIDASTDSLSLTTYAARVSKSVPGQKRTLTLTTYRAGVGNPVPGEIQSRAQNAVRVDSGTEEAFNGDFITLMKSDLGVTEGNFNELLILWLQDKLSSSTTDLQALKAEAAQDRGVASFHLISDPTGIGT